MGLLAVVVIVWVLFGIKIVPQSEARVIERLGKYHRTLMGGMHIVWPILDKAKEIQVRQRQELKRGWSAGVTGVFENGVSDDGDSSSFFLHQLTGRIDLREQVYDFAKQRVITRDNVTTRIDALLYFQIVDPVKAVYEIADLPIAIEKLTQTTLRNVVGEMELDETLTSRDTINAKLRTVLDEATNKWGVKVNRVELQEIAPPESVREAMESQMQAERNRRAAILNAEGEKKAAILKSEGEKESEINNAMAVKQSEILRAEGEAQARILQAKAEAEAITRITEAIAQTGTNPATYIIANKYIETLKEMTSGKETKTVYMPYEATGILGSVGSIKELFGEK